jgi:hypothetical protein
VAGVVVIDRDPIELRIQVLFHAAHQAARDVFQVVVGRQSLIGDIDREVCRTLLETLQWLPSNSPKKFPTLTAVQAAKMAKQKGRKDLLGPVSVNG